VANSSQHARKMADSTLRLLEVVTSTKTGGTEASSQSPFTSTWDALRSGHVRTASRLVHGRWLQVVYLLIDVLLVGSSAAAVFYLRFGSDTWEHFARIPDTSIVKDYVVFLFVYATLTVLLCESYGLYRTVRTRSSLAEVFAVFRAVLMASLLLTAAIYLAKATIISRFVIALTGLLNFIVLTAWRLWKRAIINSRIQNGINVRNVLILGSREHAENLERAFTKHKEWGYVVKGILSTDRGSRGQDIVDTLLQDARANFVDEVFVLAPVEQQLLEEVALVSRQKSLDLKLVPDTYGGITIGAPFYQLGEFPVFALYQEPIRSLALFIKRTVDVLISAVVLTVISPMLALIAIAVRLDSAGPVLYSAKRVGKKGRVFVCYKFRTMVVDADRLKQQLRAQNERQGPFFKLRNDPRITRVGKWLRRYSLDELPQFWNVLLGDMSLVGPRPHPLDDYEQYSLEHLRRLDVTPGLTGIWQVSARQDPSFERNMELDLEYIENWNIWVDFRIMAKTIPAVLRGVGE
jgi:exopolysaccharide biosynthesis polyprenyl glycosylphosphotransferase